VDPAFSAQRPGLLLHCKANSTLNTSSVKLGHAKGKKAGEGREKRRWESSSGDKSLFCSMP